MPPSRERRYIGQSVMSTPSSVTLPALGTIMPQVMRKLVVLPAPLGPRRPTISPLIDAEIDLVDYPPAAVDFHQSFGFKHSI